MREFLYIYLEEMARHITIPWILIGDFNQVIKQSDKRGGRVVRGRGVARM